MLTVLLIVTAVVLYHAMGLGVLTALMHIPGDLSPEGGVRPLVIVLWPLVLVLLGGAAVVGWGQGVVERVWRWRDRRVYAKDLARIDRTMMETHTCPPDRTLHFVDGPDGGAFFDGLGRRVMDPNAWLEEGLLAALPSRFAIHDVDRVRRGGPLANPDSDRGGRA